MARIPYVEDTSGPDLAPLADRSSPDGAAR